MACPASSTSSLLRASLRSTPRQLSTSTSSSTAASSSSRLGRRNFASSSSSANEAASIQSSISAPIMENPPRVAPPRARLTTNAKINVSLLLSRQPLLLRDPTPLESAYFDYNHAIHRRLSQPFPKELYFRKGSAAEVRFDAEELQRKQTIDISAATTSSSSSSKQAQGRKKDNDSSSMSNAAAESSNPDAELYATQSRRTKADESGDVTSLERALDRSLFLLFKDTSSGQWKLPERRVDLSQQETLHRVAAKPVTEALGEKLDIWLVSHLPIAVAPRPIEGAGTKTEDDERTYFLRGHLLSGAPESVNGKEYAWLTREEIEERLGTGQSKEYFEQIKDLLSD